MAFRSKFARKYFRQMNRGFNRGILHNVNRVSERFQKSIPANPPEVDATVLDGAVVARLLKPCGKRTFGDYAQPVFLQSVEFQLESAVERLDVVWDRFQTVWKTQQGRKYHANRHSDNESTQVAFRWIKNSGAEPGVEPSTIWTQVWNACVQMVLLKPRGGVVQLRVKLRSSLSIWTGLQTHQCLENGSHFWKTV